MNTPLHDLFGLLGRRHALAVVWHLRGPATSFAGLASALAVSPTVLTQRLRELREAGLIELDEAGDYRLTTHGRRLQGPLDQLTAFAEHWSQLTPRQRTPRGSSE